MASSTNGHYDQSLLAAAPQLSKKDYQGGYTTTILDEPARQSPQQTARDSDPELAALAPQKEKQAPLPARVPFWRTTKGIVCLVVFVVVIIGVAVGAGVGATAGKKKNNGAAAPAEGQPVADQPALPVNTVDGLADSNNPRPAPTVDSSAGTPKAPDGGRAVITNPLPTHTVESKSS